MPTPEGQKQACILDHISRAYKEFTSYAGDNSNRSLTEVLDHLLATLKREGKIEMKCVTIIRL